MEAARLDITITQGSTFSHTFKRYSEDNLNYRGEYSTLATYEVDDTVHYKGAVYKCILSGKGNAPTNVTYWTTMAVYDYSTPAHTLTGSIRTSFSEEATVADFVVSYVTDGTDGEYKIVLSSTVTAALDFKDAVYDIEATDGLTVWKEFEGVVYLKDEVTK